MLPLLLLGFLELTKVGENIKALVRVLAASLVLIGVFAMRWNVVIGGQLISKSLRGFIEFVPPLLGLNGILVSAVFMILPFVILFVITYVIPPWQEEIQPPAQRRPTF